MQRNNYWTRRYSRRQALQATGLASGALATVALVGCGDDDDSGSTSSPTVASGATAAGTAAPTIKRGGEAIFPTTPLGAQTMDPHVSLNKAFIYWGLITDRFINPHPTNVSPLEGALVEKWEQPDAQTIIMTPRANAKWHEGKITNGRAFTAEDIAYNIMRIAGKYDTQRAALFQRSTLLRGLDKVEAIDASKAKITLGAPNAAFLYGLADFRQYAVPKEQVEKDPDFQKVADFAGTGAFVIQSYDDSTSLGTYAANKNYWRQGQPYLESPCKWRW